MKTKPNKSKRNEGHSLLDNVYLASPCSIAWDTMTGDENKRSCNGCSRTVYNISDMTRQEAEAFLLANGTTECMKFYRRKDGTIMTDDCPRALRKIRDRCKLVANVAAGLVAFVVALPSALAQSIEKGDTTPIQNTLNKTISTPTSVPHLPYPGGVAIMPRPPVDSSKKDPSVNTENNSKTTINTQARIVTKKRTLSNGKKVILVAPDDDGNVIQIRGKVESKQHTNPLMDTRAAEFLAKAQQAQADKNFELAEFYFEKTLGLIDQQKSPDAGFRKRVEDDLKELKARTCKSAKGQTP